MSWEDSGTSESNARTGPHHMPSLKDEDRAYEVQRSNPWTWVREIALILVIALIISSLLRAFVVQVFWIPSPSMNNTLVEDDRIAVSRVSAWRDDIQRGDVVVFQDDLGWLNSSSTGTTDASSVLRRIGEFTGFLPAGGEQTLVKRVIGVGGDHVACCSENGRITVNGVELEETYIAGDQAPSAIDFDVVVPDGALWVMGDNRSNSADSRYHMGDGETPYVSREVVVGTVSAIIWPFGRWSTDINHREVFADVPDDE